MYLAIDLWDKRCWIAIEIEWVIFPKSIVQRYNLVNELKKIFKYYEIKKVVVWLPYDLYWKDLTQLDKTKKYIDKLSSIFKDKEFIWFDERYTTSEFKNEMNRKSDYIDDLSASLILETYFKSKNIY